MLGQLTHDEFIVFSSYLLAIVNNFDDTHHEQCWFENKQCLLSPIRIRRFCIALLDGIFDACKARPRWPADFMETFAEKRTPRLSSKTRIIHDFDQYEFFCER
jgi:hypothetical protein